MRDQRPIDADDNPVGDRRPVNFIDPSVKMPGEAGAIMQSCE